MKHSTQYEDHFGYPILREIKQIELARVPVNGNRLQDSVILHPRYVPGGVDHEIFSARVYRRGRTLDLFLDEPVIVDGTEYGVLNFKGVGADAERDLVIQPEKWYALRSLVDGLVETWVPRKTADDFNRVWGALTKGKARREFPARLFHDYHLKHAPHLALNEVPEEITTRIHEVEKGKGRHKLVQLVRGLQTNVRFDNTDVIPRNAEYRVDIEAIASADAELFKRQVCLGRQGKMIRLTGNIAGNRFVNGDFTDAENYCVDDLDLEISTLFLSRLVTSITWGSLGKARKEQYLISVEEQTRFPLSGYNDGLIRYQAIKEELKNRIRKRKK